MFGIVAYLIFIFLANFKKAVYLFLKLKNSRTKYSTVEFFAKIYHH